MSDGERTRVVAELNVGGENGTNVRLSKDDLLTASVGSQELTLREDDDFLDVDYQEYFSRVSSDTNIRIRFERENETFASAVTLPKSFELHAPVRSTLYSSNETIEVIWDADTTATNNIHLSAFISCVGASMNESFSTLDDGIHAIDFSSLTIWQDSGLDKTQNCDIRFSLTRTNNGSIAQGLAVGSNITASQDRRVTVNMTIVN